MRRHPLIGLLAALVTPACSDGVPTLAFGEICKRENDGKVLATEGHLAAPFVALCRRAERRHTSATSCSFDLRERPGGTARLSLNIVQGSGANHVDKARQDARQGAAAVADEDGKYLADQARVRVSGVLRAVANSLKPDETICWMDVEKIQRR